MNGDDPGTEPTADGDAGENPSSDADSDPTTDAARFPTFEVIPAVDMQDGEVVQLVQGERGTEKRYGEPVEAARRWVDEGAETLHLVD
ncbi:HisA/HisF-related TIM barrel protein, partial [Halobium palmae]